MPRTIDGGCLCGVIRYRLTAAPLSSIICHCRTCRRAAGAPTVAWLTVERAQFQFLSGSTAQYLSSPEVVRRFCGVCGTPLTYENSGSPHTLDVTTASLDDPNAWPPTMEVWLGHRLGWQVLNQDLGQFEHGGETPKE